MNFVTESIDGLSSENWLKIEIGRVAAMQNGSYQYASLLEFNNRQGWNMQGHVPKPVNSADSKVSIELPLSVAH